MTIHFLRHAEAEPIQVSDAERALTPKGLDQADKVAKFCQRAGLVPQLLITSPFVRARQTAEIVARKLGNVDLVVEPFLGCGMAAETFIEEIAAYKGFTTVMVVGHEPDFSDTIAVLLGLGTPESLKIRKASLTAIQLFDLRAGAGRLEFCIPARLM